MSDDATGQGQGRCSEATMNVANGAAALTSEAVEAAFLDCLFRDGEPTGDAVMPEPIVHSFGFHPSRLETHRTEVLAWIDELPTEFLVSGGGGWSFLNLCNRADGEQWTGLHLRMEQLVALAAGLGLARFLLPRDLWAALPGGVPYVAFGEAATAHTGGSAASQKVSRSGVTSA